jgi:hypothetical protein
MNKKAMDMIAYNSEKEHIVNVINETKQQIENVDNKLTQLRKFYIENKDKLDYETVKTFFDNIIYIQKYTTDEFSCYINDENDNYETFLSHYKHSCDYPTVVGFEQKGKENLKIFCDKEKMKLIFKMGLLKHKLKYYENLIKKNKITLVISWLSSLFQRLYTSVIFLIMAVLSMLAAMLSVLILNSIIYQFLNTAVMMSRVQCV